MDMLRSWHRETIVEVPTHDEMAAAYQRQRAAEQAEAERERRTSWRSMLRRARHLSAPVLMIAAVLGAGVLIRALRAYALDTWPVLVAAALVAVLGWLRARHRGEASVVCAVALGYLLVVWLGA